MIWSRKYLIVAQTGITCIEQLYTFIVQLTFFTTFINLNFLKLFNVLLYVNVHSWPLDAPHDIQQIRQQHYSHDQQHADCGDTAGEPRHKQCE